MSEAAADAHIISNNIPEGEPSDKFIQNWIEDHRLEDGSFLELEELITNSKGIAKSDLNFQWGIGPFRLKAIIDLQNLGIEVEIGSALPIIGYTKITSAGGSLRQGVKISFDVYFASGSIALTLENGKEVWIAYSFSILGIKYSGKTKICIIP